MNYTSTNLNDMALELLNSQGYGVRFLDWGICKADSATAVVMLWVKLENREREVVTLAKNLEAKSRRRNTRSVATATATDLKAFKC